MAGLASRRIVAPSGLRSGGGQPAGRRICGGMRQAVGRREDMHIELFN
jgi:hypothetical protein